MRINEEINAFGHIFFYSVNFDTQYFIIVFLQKFSEEQMFEIQAAFNSQVDKNYADYVKELLKSKQ